jgi:hypothetical protein
MNIFKLKTVMGLRFGDILQGYLDGDKRPGAAVRGRPQLPPHSIQRPERAWVLRANRRERG